MTAELLLAESLAFAGKAFLGADPGELRELAAEIEDIPEEVRKELEDNSDDLRKDYIRLFLSPSRSPCPLWQSAHTEPPALMGPAHANALAWYRSEGIEPQSLNEPADHFGLMLLFAAHLLQNGSGRFFDFRREHLGWAATLCGAVGAHAHTRFYRGLGVWTADLISRT